MSYYSLIVNVLGGLAFFLLGMKMMSDGLTKIAGDRMRRILHICAGNRISSVIAGAATTAVVQSSSATTVMAVGFVNAGLLTLVQAIGIIFGANIGTTITAQIVAFNISSIAMPAILIGFVMTVLPWKRILGWGDTLLGFGLLFFGMNLMSSELKALSTNQTFIGFFQLFDCAPTNGFLPFGSMLGAIGVGLIATVLIQSSSAATGIVIALGGSGLIDIYTATALILGSNIGTTITAQLAAIPANRPAKQTALAHTLFNVAGVAFMFLTFLIPWGSARVPVFFYLTGLMTNGDGMNLTHDVPRLIANAHTLFNVITTLLLLPFVNQFAKLCQKLIPVREEVRYQYLEPHLLNSPELALNQVVFALRKMLAKSWKIVDQATTKIFIPVSMEQVVLDKIARREARIDRYQSEIMDYLSEVVKRNISDRLASRIPPLIHCTNDAERIGDRAENITVLASRMKEAGRTFSQAAMSELEQLFKLLAKQSSAAIEALEDSKKYAPELNAEMERAIREYASAMERTHTARIQSGECSSEAGLIFLEFTSEIVAISRHLSNIHERVAQIE